MSITENIDRIEQGKTSIISSIKNKGVNVPSGVLINEIAPYINEIQSGGGDTPDTPRTELEQKYEGATVIRVNIPTDNYEFAINLCNDATKATYNVDWGDNILENSLTTDEQHHTYAKAGIYDINIYNLSKNITLGGYNNPSNKYIPYLFNNSNNDTWNFIYIETKDNLTVSDILIGNKITSIGESAFYGCSSLQSVVIPEGVTSIGSSAFQDCTSLQSIVIPEGVTSIGSSAFQDCTSLQSIVIPEGVTSIGSYAFQDCTSLQSIVIPEGVTSIGSNAFQDCTSLQSIVIPEGVTSIGGSAFQNCTSLQSIVIPEGVTTIGNSAFRGCTSLQSIVIPEGVTSIGSYAFNGCSFLQSIEVNAMTAPTIQSSSFPTSSFKYTKRYLYVPKDATGYDTGNWKTYLIDNGWELRYIEEHIKTPTTMKLKTVNNFLHKWDYIGDAKLVDYDLIDNEYIYHFDDKIEEIVQNTFYKEKLKEIELPEGVTSIGSSAFYDCSSLQSVVIPEGVTSIGSYAFQYCTSLQSVVIPEGVTTISDYAFQDCTSLQSVVIPEGVTSIGGNAFNSCYYLQSITVNAMTAPTIQGNTFSNVGTKVPSGTPKILRVPKGATRYETGNWKTYLLDKGYTLEYIEPEEPEIEPEENEALILTNLSEEQNTFTVKLPNYRTYSYKINNDEWSSASGENSFTVEPNSKLYLKDTYRTKSAGNNAMITATANFKVSGILPDGNIDYAYNNMFYGNTYLVDASELELTADKVGDESYNYMFSHCTNLLLTPRILPAKSLSSVSYSEMFSFCKEITNTPIMYANPTVLYSYSKMYYNCSKLNYVKMYVDNWNREMSVSSNWLYGVASEGTIETNCTNIPIDSADGVPIGWIVKPIEE